MKEKKRQYIKKRKEQIKNKEKDIVFTLKRSGLEFIGPTLHLNIRIKASSVFLLRSLKILEQ